MSISRNLNATDSPQGVFEVPLGQQAVVSVAGSWSFDPGRTACGAAGVGGPIGDGSFPVPAAPIGCLFWQAKPPGQIVQGVQEGIGWFTSNDQKISFTGDAKDYPGQACAYSFGINDNTLTDNSGFLTLTWNVQPQQ